MIHWGPFYRHYPQGSARMGGLLRVPWAAFRSPTFSRFISPGTPVLGDQQPQDGGWQEADRLASVQALTALL